MKKKILLIAESNMSLSGVPVVYMSIVRTLHNEFDFDIIILKNNDLFFKDEFLSYGGQIYHFDCQKPKSLIKKISWYLGSYHNEFKKFLHHHHINLNNYSAIHSFNEYFSYPFFKEAKRANIKNIILHICSAASAYPSKKSIKQSLWNFYQKRSLKFCSTILFVSHKSMFYNNYKNKGRVLYNIYDEEKYSTLITYEGNGLSLTQIGTFSSRKNQLFSIKVLENILKTYPDAHLNIVGKSINDGYTEQMLEYIEHTTVKNNISILDTTTDRIDLNKKTSFILYPSVQDSFGLVLIESQASGIHCFSSNLVPNDADMGNVEFLELDSELWSNKIISYFRKNGNNRTDPINKEKFSLETFRNSLLNIYNS